MKKSRKKIHIDSFLQYLYTGSPLSQTTQRIYTDWVTRCCQHYHVQHILDLSPGDLEGFRLYLLQERRFSPASDTIVYNAFRHTFGILLPQILPGEASRFASLFQIAPRQPHLLPRYIDKALLQEFLSSLPKTPVGYILTQIYRTSRPFREVKAGWKCSYQYAAAVCAKIARQVGIPHGFGMTGLRGVSLIHRLQERKDDSELKILFEQSGISPAQFALYVRAADHLIDTTS